MERWFVDAHRKVMSIRPEEQERYIEVVRASEADRLREAMERAEAMLVHDQRATVRAAALELRGALDV